MKKLFFVTLFLLVLVPYSLLAQEVDILWQGNNYTAPFYRGLPLWSKQSEITFVAIPHNLGTASSLNYLWSRNGTVLGTVSGVGRSSLTFLDTIFSKPVSIRVEIRSEEDETLAEKSINITPTIPALLIYEDNPLYGFMFHEEISSPYKLNDGEVTFAAFPFFFSASNRTNPELNYSWKSNAGSSENKNSVTYRAPEEGKGSASVSVTVSSKDFLTQTANKNFLVQFGNDNE